MSSPATTAPSTTDSFFLGMRMFVPVEQITRLSRYSGAEGPALSKLGGWDWQRTKARVRKGG